MEIFTSRMEYLSKECPGVGKNCVTLNLHDGDLFPTGDRNGLLTFDLIKDSRQNST